VWFRQLQRLLACFLKFVDKDSTEPSGDSAVTVLLVGESEQEFAGEVGDHEHNRTAWYEPGEGRRQEEDPHVGVAVRAVEVREPGGSPSHAIGRDDRGAAFGVNRQDATGGVHEVSS
jgi:hypothetical protein